MGNPLRMISSLTGGAPWCYSPQVFSISDYYTFGSLMPKRNASSNAYRYGFNGMEKDDEVKGGGNSYTTLFRQYDPRLGRWLSVDPESSLLPWQSPYVGMDNQPVIVVDPDGDIGNVIAGVALGLV